MLKFKTVRSTFAYLSSNLLNEVGLSLFRYFEVGLRVCDIVVKKFTFAISSPDEFLLLSCVDFACAKVLLPYSILRLLLLLLSLWLFPRDGLDDLTSSSVSSSIST